jgi:hypothetical protein
MGNTSLIYNVTISVEPEVHEKWLSWMLEVHLRDMLATGCFLGFRFCELQGTEDAGPTFTVQYELASQEDFAHYEQEFAPSMRDKGQEQFGTKALTFRTTMQVIAQGTLRDQ